MFIPVRLFPFRISDPWVKKTTDPGSESATLIFTLTTAASSTPSPANIDRLTTCTLPTAILLKISKRFVEHVLDFYTTLCANVLVCGSGYRSVLKLANQNKLWIQIIWHTLDHTDTGTFYKNKSKLYNLQLLFFNNQTIISVPQ
jgi:hypothetical protein